MTWDNLLIGVIAGVVSAIVCGLFRKIIHPRIDIWDFVIYDKESQKVIVKIVNKTRSRVTDVDCRLQFYKNEAGRNSQSIDLPSVHPIQPAIEKFVNDSNDANALSLYAVQIAFRADELVTLYGEDFMKDSDKFVFSIKSVLPFTNTVTFKTQEFPCDSCEKKVLFNSVFNKGFNKGWSKVD